jgi:coenzyme F420-reducing hydrogenase alpha subunit
VSILNDIADAIHAHDLHNYHTMLTSVFVGEEEYKAIIAMGIDLCMRGPIIKVMGLELVQVKRDSYFKVA